MKGVLCTRTSTSVRVLINSLREAVYSKCKSKDHIRRRDVAESEHLANSIGELPRLEQLRNFVVPAHDAFARTEDLRKHISSSDGCMSTQSPCPKPICDLDLIVLIHCIKISAC